MDKKNFDLLMQSLEEVKDFSKGKKTNVKITKWEIKPTIDYSPEDVARIRKAIGLSQPLFAELLGVSSKTIQSWEQGLSQPSGAASRLLEAMDKSKEQCLTLYRDIKVIRAS